MVNRTAFYDILYRTMKVHSKRAGQTCISSSSGYETICKYDTMVDKSCMSQSEQCYALAEPAGASKNAKQVLPHDFSWPPSELSASH